MPQAWPTTVAWALAEAVVLAGSLNAPDAVAWLVTEPLIVPEASNVTSAPGPTLNEAAPPGRVIVSSTSEPVQVNVSLLLWTAHWWETELSLQTDGWSGVLVRVMPQAWPTTVAWALAEAVVLAGSLNAPDAVDTLPYTPLFRSEASNVTSAPGPTLNEAAPPGRVIVSSTSEPVQVNVSL